MKYSTTFIGLVAGTVLLMASGCSKEEPIASPDAKAPEAVAPAASPAATAAAVEAPAVPAPAPAVQPAAKAPDAPPAPAAPASAAAAPAALAPAAPAPAAAAPQAVTDPLQAMAAAATNTLASALGTTNQLAAAAATQVQALLDQAKSLTANEKYQEALATLTQLYNTQLTAEQKQQVDALKAKIQTAMSQKASSTLGNFLGGKK